MTKAENHQKFLRLREEFPCFTFENYTLTKTKNSIKLEFEFHLSDCHIFYPKLEFPIKDSKLIETTSLSDIDNIAFQIGMIELLSYWKSSCCPQIIIKPFKLTEDQINWWKKLYYKGLGEFFYLNGIQTDFDHFVNITSDSNIKAQKSVQTLKDEVIVPIGGGKDSVVSVELLKKKYPNLHTLVLNQNPSRKRSIENAGIAEQNTIHIIRSLDAKLLELNSQGFLNGHTPFSALLAFVSVACGLIYRIKNIALSNESSANEATDLVSGANHQYSKSFEFESDFRYYYTHYIHNDLNYYSFLRPLNELQIAKIFSKFDHHFKSFRSCNIGSKKDIWCEKCSKCLFTYIILSAFLESKQLQTIFQTNLLDQSELKPIFDELIGESNVKPFECVGTLDDVNVALQLFIEQNKEVEYPYLIQYYQDTQTYKDYQKRNHTSFLNELNPEHFLSDQDLDILKNEL